MWLDGDKTNLGMQTNPDGSIYKGQFFCNNYFGYGELYSKDGTTYKGFWMWNKKQGIGLSIDSDKRVTYQVFDDDEPIKDLTKEEVDEINQKKIYPQMTAFFDRDTNIYEQLKYAEDDSFDFNWISKQGREIKLVTDDLVSFAKKSNMFDHELGEKTQKQLDELEKTMDDTLDTLKKKKAHLKKVLKDASIAA